MQKTQIQECKKCINNSLNPSIFFDEKGYCNICQNYLRNFDKKQLQEEKKFLKMFLAKNPNVLVGFSGGKDSSAALYLVKKMGFKPLAFTFDIGYYPEHTFIRAKEIAKKLEVPYERIDIRKYIREIDKKCYKLMADLYYEKESPELFLKFRKLYQEGRKHYSVKCKHIFPFVRTCQLCRKTVIRAYYQEALNRGADVVVLGANEWAGLSQTLEGREGKLSAIRKLQPNKTKKPVYVVHLPFLLQRKLKDNLKILKEIGWEKPEGENLVESNSNSCLLGLAAEAKAFRMLGFHPDTTRLAREVTAGFLSKKEARNALSKVHKYKKSVGDVLIDAKILK